MKILWAVSSVGKGHVMRDMAIANRLELSGDADIDWLAPSPAGVFMRQRGHHVLEESSRLAGSGKIYDRVFADCSDEYNLMEYIRVETKLHKHDFMVSREAWEKTAYDVIVGDEAFWLLSGFSSKWGKKPAPFVFITDFIGTRAMRPRITDRFTAWKNNLGFSFSHMGPDEYLFIGNPAEIPDERLGLFLPNRRKWAKTHCRFVKPVIGFDPSKTMARGLLRNNLGLPEEQKIFLAVVGPEGNVRARADAMEQVFGHLKKDFPEAVFIMVCPEKRGIDWIEYHRFLDPLHHYFAASDFVITQSGYGKVAELSALGIPFIAIPLNYHFEQEFFMGCRIDHYKTGTLMTLRDTSAEKMADFAKQAMHLPVPRIATDDGSEIAGIILNAASIRPSIRRKI
jgi:hypothetical protein